jgi:hypothetical protein
MSSQQKPWTDRRLEIERRHQQQREEHRSEESRKRRDVDRHVRERLEAEKTTSTKRRKSIFRGQPTINTTTKRDEVEEAVLSLSASPSSILDLEMGEWLQPRAPPTPGKDPQAVVNRNQETSEMESVSSSGNGYLLATNPKETEDTKRPAMVAMQPLQDAEYPEVPQQENVPPQAEQVVLQLQPQNSGGIHAKRPEFVTLRVSYFEVLQAEAAMGRAYRALTKSENLVEALRERNSNIDMSLTYH